MTAASARSARFALAFGIALSVVACARQSPEAREHAAALGRDRAAKDAYFAGPSSPLTPEQRATYRGLHYYPPALRWSVRARFEPAAHPDTVSFPTSKQTFDTYLRSGTLRFALAGQPQSLDLFRALDDGHWFLPFTDASAGRTTYGAGRYLDPDIVEGQPVTLDFNRAYNPYCAYNAGWICPLAPPENRLHLAIEAGEKSFVDGH
jgi:hypothetical protein